MNLLNRFLNKSKKLEPTEFHKKITQKLGFEPTHIDLYKKVFIHRSANISDENGRIQSYERLEFLGDSVLSLVIAQHLFESLKEKQIQRN